jgi:hypothetical protein
VADFFGSGWEALAWTAARRAFAVLDDIRDFSNLGFPSGALIIIIIIHLLGLAPAGCLTAPDNGPKGLMRVVLVKYPRAC